MSKITSKYQLGIPKALADRMGIRPGDAAADLPARDGGRARSFTTAAALVDTNVLVYRYHPRDSRKQRMATELLRRSDGRTAGCE